MTKIIFIITMLISYSVFSQNLNMEDERERIIKALDTLDYSESDFNSMKNYTKEQKGFQEIMSKKVLEGDKNIMILVDILNLSFNQAKAKYGKKEINALIFSHNKSIETINKFKALNEAFQLELDSLEKQKTYIIHKEMKKEVDDSLLKQQSYIDKKLQKELDAYKKKMDSLKQED